MKPLFPRGAVAPKKGTLLGGTVYLLVYLFGLRLLLAPLMQLLNVDITPNTARILQMWPFSRSISSASR